MFGSIMVGLAGPYANIPGLVAVISIGFDLAITSWFNFWFG